MAGNGRRPTGSGRTAMAPGTPAWRGRLASAELGQVGLGPEPRAGPEPFPPLGYAGRKRPWASRSHGPAQY